MVLFCCQNDESAVVEKRSEIIEKEKKGLLRCASPVLTTKFVKHVKVYLNVYSLLKMNTKLKRLGMGVYHTGVVVYGLEWGYGEAVDHTTPSGLFYVSPGHAAGTLYRTITLGVTTHSPEQVDTILHRLENEWPSADYHILNHNCNHFAKRFCDLLSTVQKLEFPKWCNRAARFCSKIVPRRLATYVHRLIDEDPPKVPASGFSRVNEIPVSVIPPYWYLHPSISQEPRYILKQAQPVVQHARQERKIEQDNKQQQQQQQHHSDSMLEATCDGGNVVNWAENKDNLGNVIPNMCTHVLSHNTEHGDMSTLSLGGTLKRENLNGVVYVGSGRVTCVVESDVDNGNSSKLNASNLLSFANTMDGCNLFKMPNIMLMEEREVYDATGKRNCVNSESVLPGSVHVNANNGPRLRNFALKNNNTSFSLSSAMTGHIFENDCNANNDYDSDDDDGDYKDDSCEHYIFKNSYVCYDDVDYDDDDDDDDDYNDEIYYGVNVKPNCSLNNDNIITTKRTLLRSTIPSSSSSSETPTPTTLPAPTPTPKIFSSDIFSSGTQKSASSANLKANLHLSYPQKNLSDYSYKSIYSINNEKPLVFKQVSSSNTSNIRQDKKNLCYLPLVEEEKVNFSMPLLDDIYTDPGDCDGNFKSSEIDDKFYVNFSNVRGCRRSSLLPIKVTHSRRKMTADFVNPLLQLQVYNNNNSYKNNSNNNSYRSNNNNNNKRAELRRKSVS